MSDLPTLNSSVATSLDASGAEPPARTKRRKPLPPAPAVLLFPPVDSEVLRHGYQASLDRLRIRERYPSPDWNIGDRWFAREPLPTGATPGLVAARSCVMATGQPWRDVDVAMSDGSSCDASQRFVANGSAQVLRLGQVAVTQASLGPLSLRSFNPFASSAR